MFWNLHCVMVSGTCKMLSGKLKLENVITISWRSWHVLQVFFIFPYFISFKIFFTCEWIMCVIYLAWFFFNKKFEIWIWSNRLLERWRSNQAKAWAVCKGVDSVIRSCLYGKCECVFGILEVFQMTFCAVRFYFLQNWTFMLKHVLVCYMMN